MNARTNMDWQLAKKLALEAINDYQENKAMPGLCHGELGKTRAKNVKAYLEATRTKEAFFSAMFAIFGEFDKTILTVKINKSSGLIGLIAEKWLTGGYLYFVNSAKFFHKNTLSSSIFSESLLKESVKKNMHAHVYGLGKSQVLDKQVDKTASANWLLKEVLKRDYSPKEQANILVLAKTLHGQFISHQIPDVQEHAVVTYWL